MARVHGPAAYAIAAHEIRLANQEVVVSISLSDLPKRLRPPVFLRDLDLVPVSPMINAATLG